MIVKVLSRQGGKALIEWTEEGELRRAIVPGDEVSAAGEIDSPERGLEYGVPFADYVEVDVTPLDIQRALYNAGIWTVEDVFARPAEVQGAINSAYGAVLRNLLRNLRNNM